MEIKEVTNKDLWEDFLLGGEESKLSSSPTELPKETKARKRVEPSFDFAVAREVEELRSSPPSLRSVCEEKTFLQSWNWGEFQKRMGNKIWRLGVFDNEKLDGIALISKIVAKRGTFLLIQHGPVISQTSQKKEIFQVFLEELKKIGKAEEASFIRMNPLWERNQENQNIFKNLDFKEAPMHANAYEATLKLDITFSEDELLMEMRKTARYLIRQALKNNELEIFQSQRLEDIDTFNDLQKEVVKFQHFVPFSLDYLKNEFSVFQPDNQISLFLARYQGEIIAGALVLFWSNIGFYHDAALIPKFHKIPAAYLLLWEAIKEAKRRGCSLYDFWGYIDPKEQPKHPWAGPTLFKMGFGGYKKEYVKTQDLVLNSRYWLNFIIEKIRKQKRGL